MKAASWEPRCSSASRSLSDPDQRLVLPDPARASAAAGTRTRAWHGPCAPGTAPAADQGRGGAGAAVPAKQCQGSGSPRFCGSRSGPSPGLGVGKQQVGQPGV